MRIAYLTNQYPKVSHSFIRREIEALEATGATVERFTMRLVDEPLVDEADARERAKTTALVDVPRSVLAAATARQAALRPARFALASARALELGARGGRGVVRNVGYLAAACVLADAIEERRIDHVHAHFGTNPAAVAYLCKILIGTSYSFTVHGPEEFDATHALGLDAKIADASFVVAVSSFGMSQLRRVVDPSLWPKLLVVRCGVDGTYLDREPTGVPDGRILVSVGRLCEQKGQLTLIDAAAEVIARGVTLELVLVGDGPMRAAIESRASALGIASSVRITGWANGETVQREIERARAFVLPSYAEGLPLVIMEALALGRPVISTYVAGIPELVENGVDGWLVPAGAASPLADAMEACLATPTSRLSEMGRAGRARVAALHDVAKSAKAIREAVARAIKGAGAR